MLFDRSPFRRSPATRARQEARATEALLMARLAAAKAQAAGAAAGEGGGGGRGGGGGGGRGGGGSSASGATSSRGGASGVLVTGGRGVHVVMDEVRGEVGRRHGYAVGGSLYAAQKCAPVPSAVNVSFAETPLSLVILCVFIIFCAAGRAPRTPGRAAARTLPPWPTRGLACARTATSAGTCGSSSCSPRAPCPWWSPTGSCCRLTR